MEIDCRKFAAEDAAEDEAKNASSNGKQTGKQATPPQMTFKSKKK